MGRYAAAGGMWRTPAPWAFLLATVTWMLTMWRNTPCIQTSPDSYPPTFAYLCYTDIPVLYINRGLAEGSIPLVDQPMEYPVLTAWFMELARSAVNWFGGYSGPDPDPWQVIHGAQLFYGITAVLMFGCFLGLVFVHLRLHRPWDALLIAASPLVVAGGLINWDLLVVFLGSAAILAWSRGRITIAGLLMGLAIAAKLYPVFWLLPFAVLCLRIGKVKQFVVFGAATVAGWTAVNLPMFLISRDNWLNFWTFNVDRTADLGSIWYVLKLARIEVPGVSEIVAGLLVLCGLALAALILLAPRRPRLAQTLFLITVAFLVLNKVYSPQYMLWLLPLLVLARPRAREWVIFTIAELLYWAAIWGHLGQYLNPADGGQDKLYWLAVLLRIAVQVWLAGLVVRDIRYPQYDPIRAPQWTIDDPDGGIFDHAPDRPWVTSLRRRFGLRAWPAPDALTAIPTHEPVSAGEAEPERELAPLGIFRSETPAVEQGSPPEAPARATAHQGSTTPATHVEDSPSGDSSASPSPLDTPGTAGAPAASDTPDAHPGSLPLGDDDAADTASRPTADGPQS